MKNLPAVLRRFRQDAVVTAFAGCIDHMATPGQGSSTSRPSAK
jgi:hypothetical protein